MEFKTIKEAEKAGYILPKYVKRFTELESLKYIVKNDTSGPSSFGYSFDVVLKD